MKLLEGDKLLVQVGWLHPEGRGGPWHRPPLQGLASQPQVASVGSFLLRAPNVPPALHSRPESPPGTPAQGPHSLRASLRHGRPPSVPPVSCELLGGPEMLWNPHLLKKWAALPLCWVHPRPDRLTRSPALRPVGKLPWACRARFLMGWGLPSALLPGLGPQRAEARPDPGPSSARGRRVGDG